MMFLLLLCLATANAGLVRREEKFQRYNEDTMEDDLKEFMEKVTGLEECNWKFAATIEACEVCVQNECGQEMKRYSSPKEPLDQVERGFKDASSGLVSGLESVVKKNRRVFDTGDNNSGYVSGSVSDNINGNGNSYNKQIGNGNGNENNYQNGNGNSNGDNNRNGNGNGNVYGYGYPRYYRHIDTGRGFKVASSGLVSGLESVFKKNRRVFDTGDNNSGHVSGSVSDNISGNDNSYNNGNGNGGYLDGIFGDNMYHEDNSYNNGNGNGNGYPRYYRHIDTGRGFKDSSSGLVSGLESVVKKNRRVFDTGDNNSGHVSGSVSDNINGNGNSYNKQIGNGNGNGNNYQHGNGNSNGDNNRNGNGNGNVYGYGYGYPRYYRHIDTGRGFKDASSGLVSGLESVFKKNRRVFDTGDNNSGHVSGSVSDNINGNDNDYNKQIGNGNGNGNNYQHGNGNSNGDNNRNGNGNGNVYGYGYGYGYPRYYRHIDTGRGFKDASSGLVSGLESVFKKNRRVFDTGDNNSGHVSGSVSGNINGNDNSYNKQIGNGNGNGNNYQHGNGNSNGDNNRNGNGNGNFYGYGYGYPRYYRHIDTGIQPGVTATKRFGEMRREVNAATRHCMDECTDCQKFLLNTTEMIRNVCGPRLLDADTNSKAKMERVMEYLDKLN